MPLLNVPTMESVVEVLQKVFEKPSVRTFPLHREVEGSLWDSVVAVKLHDVSTTVLLKTDGFHVEVRHDMVAETKTCGLSVKDMVEYVVSENLRFLSRHISERTLSASKLRLHESLLVKTLS